MPVTKAAWRHYWPNKLKNILAKRSHQVCSHLYYSVWQILGTEATDKYHTHTHTPVWEHEDMRVLWNQGAHTDREVTANRPDIIIKYKRQKRCLLILHARGEKCHAKGSRKLNKIQRFFVYRYNEFETWTVWVCLY